MPFYSFRCIECDEAIETVEFPRSQILQADFEWPQYDCKACKKKKCVVRNIRDDNISASVPPNFCSENLYSRYGNKKIV